VSQARHSHDHERETESDLLLRVRTGDMDAFAELAERNRTTALAVAKTIVDPATAEDVVADSIERLLLILKRGEGPTYSVRPYFLQMVRNRAIDYRRRAVEFPVDPAEQKPELAVVPDEADATVVRNAFEALPERWQAALWLGVVESRSHAEIGRELDVAEGAATQLLHRAREGLRQSYLNAQLGTGEDCTQLSGLLGKYVREQASPRDSRRINAHLAECAQCRAALGRTKKLNSRIGAVLASAVLGGIALEVLRRPADAAAASFFGQPARAIEALKVAGKTRHVVGALVGLTVTAGLLFGIPANSPGVQLDAIMRSLPGIGTFVPSVTPTPTPTPTPSASATPTPSEADASVRPNPKPSSASPKPSCPAGCQTAPSPNPSVITVETPPATPIPTPSATPPDTASPTPIASPTPAAPISPALCDVADSEMPPECGLGKG
jgi:RNA polymerase sigma factor (sigma-70 family)